MGFLFFLCVAFFAKQFLNSNFCTATFTTFNFSACGCIKIKCRPVNGKMTESRKDWTGHSHVLAIKNGLAGFDISDFA